MATSTAAPAVPDTWDEAWSRALDEMELDVEATETLLVALHAGQDLPRAEDVLSARWDPPRGLGPVPRPLIERATALVRRQQELSLRLVEATHVNRRHARAAVALREKAPAVPVYLDVAL